MSYFSNNLNKIWHGLNPYTNFPTGLYPDNRSELSPEAHPYLMDGVLNRKPKLIVEVGVWKGSSSIAMAKAAKTVGLDVCIVAIDTWLGSSEHWRIENNWHSSLNFEFGQPMLMRTFMNNVILSGVDDVIIPLPLDSTNSSVLFREAKMPQIDIIHIDAGHDYRSVMNDLEIWWPLVAPGGLLVGDDYLHTGEWPEVRQAFDEFFGRIGLMPLEFGGNKCRIEKR